MMRFTVILLIAFCSSLQLDAQLYNYASVKSSSGSVISINESVSNTGDWNNQGTVVLTGDLTGTGNFDSSVGAIQLTGNDQAVSMNGSLESLMISGGGIKSFDQPVVVSGQLTLDEGFLNISQIEAGSLSGGNNLSYVTGIMQLTGSDSLFFPIGTLTSYRPVWTSDVNPADQIAASFLDDPITGQAGYGLLAVASQGYWSLSGATQPFRVWLPSGPATFNESELVVAATNQPDSEWSSRGGMIDPINGLVAASDGSLSQFYSYGQFFDEQLRVVDSVGLVSLYQQADGSDWFDTEGWLTSKLDDWVGVSLTNKRVTSLDLSANDLNGAIIFGETGLENLVSLDVSNNEISEIDGLANLPSLSQVDISSNRLEFGTIEAAVDAIETVTYQDQKPILDSIRVLLEIGTTYSVDRLVSGSANHYAWYRNAEPTGETASAFDITINGFTDEGTFYAEVTSDVITDMTLQTRPVVLLVSSLERDSASLMEMYTLLNGSTWTKGSNWPTLPLNQWEEVTTASNRVTGLAMSGSNINGKLPQSLLDITELETVDLSNNNLTGIPDLNSLDQLASFDVSGNKLEFDDIEPNVGISGLDYLDQQSFGSLLYTQIDAGSSYDLGFSVGGSQNQYIWKLDGNPIAGSQNTTHTIEAIDYESMGTYTMEVTSSLVPGLTLKSRPQTILAQSNLSIIPYYRDFFGTIKALDEGDAYLFKINEPGQPYDTMAIQTNISGEILFEEMVLDDYLVLVDTDLEVVEEQNGSTATVSLLPTYYKSTIDWVEADTIELRDQFSDSLRMQRLVEGNLGGFGIVGLTVESEFASDASSGRIESRRRVRKAGCSLRRNTRVGGGREEEDDEWELIAYQETDDEGEVSFGFLPSGLYRLNIQYPGIPMDPDSFIEFEITEEEEKDGYQLNALITEEAITVSLVEELALYHEYFEGLNVYPVPASDVLHIDFAKLSSRHVKMYLYNMEGRVIQQMDIPKSVNQSLELDVSDSPDGIYLLRFVNEQGETDTIVTYKIIIRK